MRYVLLVFLMLLLWAVVSLVSTFILERPDPTMIQQRVPDATEAMKSDVLAYGSWVRTQLIVVGVGTLLLVLAAFGLQLFRRPLRRFGWLLSLFLSALVGVLLGRKVVKDSVQWAGAQTDTYLQAGLRDLSIAKRVSVSDSLFRSGDWATWLLIDAVLIVLLSVLLALLGNYLFRLRFRWHRPRSSAPRAGQSRG